MFNTLLQTAQKSLWNRKGTALLTILSVALSVLLLLGIERIRNSARSSFESTVSGVDLIVGARGGAVNLLLYSVFRIGNATNNISQTTYSEIVQNENVEWAIPISLGDSHKGFKVVGTNDSYIQHYRYAGDKNLDLISGQWNHDVFDVVIGSKVAQSLGYKVGDQIVLSHGTDEVSFQDHDNMPFTIKGVLAPTGTPVDSSLHISLKAMTALHLDWDDGIFDSSKTHDKNWNEIEDSAVTAVLLKLKSKIQIFNVQRFINDYSQEPLSAIMPGVSLGELWQTLGMAESVLIIVSMMVFVVSMLAMLIALLTSLNERRREMAILRSIGASKNFIFSLLVVESVLLVGAGIVLGNVILYSALWILRPALEQQMGLSLNLFMPSKVEGLYLVLIIVCALFTSLIPAWKAYRNSLADGLTIKI